LFAHCGVSDSELVTGMTIDSFSLADRLADLPYFRSVHPDRLAALAEYAINRQFPAGAMIFGQDEPASGLWIIEHGTAKIFRLSPDGREYILRLVGPGDSFNDIPALDGGPNAASVITLSDVSAWMVPGDLVVDELHADPAMALDVVHILTDRIRELVQQWRIWRCVPSRRGWRAS
jgi:CRP-like cAMP-binding protein